METNRAQVLQKIDASNPKDVTLHDIFTRTMPKTRELRSEVRDESKHELFQDVLSEQPIKLDKLRQLAWFGVPDDLRGRVWRQLLGIKRVTQEERKQCTRELNQAGRYFQDRSLNLELPVSPLILKYIHSDVLRLRPDLSLFRAPLIQSMVRKVLLYWQIKHPHYSYSSSLGDMLVPFLLVFLGEQLKVPATSVTPAHLESIQQQSWGRMTCDSYHCFRLVYQMFIGSSYVMHQSQISYVPLLKKIIARHCPSILANFDRQSVIIESVLFYRTHCLMCLQFSLQTWLRVLDSLFCQPADCHINCVFIAASTLLHYSQFLSQAHYEKLMTYLYDFPTKKWGHQEAGGAIAQAYVYKTQMNSEM